MLKIYKITHYSTEPGDRIFVERDGFLFFAKNIGKNLSRNINGKHSQKLLDHAKQSATNELKPT